MASNAAGSADAVAAHPNADLLLAGPGPAEILQKQAKPVVNLPDTRVVVLDYADLASGENLTQSIEAAFGPKGLGLIAVRNTPEFLQHKRRLLPLAYQFAGLPEPIKAKYVDEKSTYSFGWSHGKEQMRAGVPDYAKGSYYANPLRDGVEGVAADAQTKYPSFYSPNLWPTADLPDLEPAFKTLARLMCTVGFLLLKQCDAFVATQNPSYDAERLYSVVGRSLMCKGRLLNYFAVDSESGTKMVQALGDGADASEDSWCGWHNDHGSLTGLAGALYTNKDGEEIPSPDDGGGLYIKTRSGELVRAKIPPDCMAFQIGETAQIHTGGVLQATPHAVRGGKTLGVSRQQLAVFMEPEHDCPMTIPAGATEQSTLEASTSEYLPPNVPVLSSRWSMKIESDFGGFSERTLGSYSVDAAATDDQTA